MFAAPVQRQGNIKHNIIKISPSQLQHVSVQRRKLVAAATPRMLSTLSCSISEEYKHAPTDTHGSPPRPPPHPCGFTWVEFRFSLNPFTSPRSRLTNLQLASHAGHVSLQAASPLPPSSLSPHPLPRSSPRPCCHLISSPRPFFLPPPHAASDPICYSLPGLSTASTSTNWCFMARSMSSIVGARSNRYARFPPNPWKST